MQQSKPIMTIYFRSEDIPELAGLSKWERRVFLRGTFLKERTLSSMVLMIVVLGSVHFIINPILMSQFPGIRESSMLYLVILVSWLLLWMLVRDIVMMNFLRPRIAAKRAELEAKKAAAGSSAAA